MGDTINIISWNVRGLDYPNKGGCQMGASLFQL